MQILPAPLAGWTDYAFRRVLVACGAQEVWTEMIAATALARGNAKTVKMITTIPEPVYQVVQLFGNNVADFVTAIKSGVLKDYAEINVNLGCPAHKIVKNHSGSWYMTDFKRTRELLTACREATRATGQKLSVKCRLGWDTDVAVPFAQLCANCGVDRIIVHGRLGVDGYRGVADWHAIARVKAAVSVPVIANGDVRDRARAEHCLAVTGADGVMLGRALCGAPWRIRLDDCLPPADEINRLMDLQAQWHNGNPSDLIKHNLAYAKHLKHCQ